MAKLTIAERFKDARTVHNIHGKQTLREVAAATGVTASTISDLERDSGRDVGYKNIIELAKHYDVSIDWLLGLTDTRKIDKSLQAACDYTYLSESGATAVRYVMRDADWREAEVIGDNLSDFLKGILRYSRAAIASALNSYVTEEHYQNWEMNESAISKLAHALTVGIDSEAGDYLIFEHAMNSWALNQMERTYGFMESPSNISLSSIYYGEANRAFNRFIQAIDKLASDIAEDIVLEEASTLEDMG